MHSNQRAFFKDKRRFHLSSSRRHGHYAQKQKEVLLKAMEAMDVMDNIEIIAIDECREMTMEDFEEITEAQRDCTELQGGIQTEKSDWLQQFVREQGKDES